ncbi:MAG: SMP-30/gluconolactonase/LRE family protein [Actinobacteria bacterium]|nr:SMP-30/gluconolactonase/LRE family protein [Actinomycetota bacterium]
MMKIFASDLDHPEGLAWSPRGWVAAGGEAGQVYRIDPANGAVTEIAHTGGFILGMAFDGEDNLYLCDMGRNAVLRLNTLTGEISDLTTGKVPRPLNSPNFPVFHSDGRLFFSESGNWGARNGSLYCIHPNGDVTVESEEVGAFTNGLAIDPDEKYLYVVESENPQISRCAISSDSLSSPELVVSMPQTVPDGLVFTSTGDLIICCYRPDAIFLWDGKKLSEIINDWSAILLAAPTNAAFIGENLERFVTANLAGRYLAELEIAHRGAKLKYPIR